ncbi:neutral/alkaline non-lysosomal ceramidase N-terminal domain-containing protein [Chryseolinea sp. T2]|uniref:neutral/alkaline non-lysosomal ceramidase N-terminal domain-containing protein n=1 Tax=Chryseolinea sp. T2 TaxID=3129255 RepID=UPI0030783AAF
MVLTLIKRILKILLIVIGALVAVVLVIAALVLIPQDRGVHHETLISEMHKRVDSLGTPVEGTRGFTVGYAKENITPTYLTATAGYGNRLGKKVTSIHDSIYVRCIVVDNGASKVAIVTADLLLMPPEVALLLESELSSIGFSPDNTFFGATHSHNSVGNWSHGAMTVMYGDYDDALVHHIKDNILLAIKNADASKVKASISAAHIPVTDAVRNRINKNNPVDSLLRVIRIVRSDSAKLLLLNFTAHATCLSDDNIVLSGDYPGLLTKSLEQQGYKFAMFMAGAVGSHAGKTKEREWPCVEEMSSKLATAMKQNSGAFEPVADTTLWMGRVKLSLTEAQFKVSKTWRLRPSTFNGLMGDYPEYITGLRIGNQLMLGTPCDFSGEFYPALDSMAATRDLNLMVTSFNGGYIGYVTPERYYDVNHYETQLMNWYGPGTGEYLMTCLEMLIDHAGNDGVDFGEINTKR